MTEPAGDVGEECARHHMGDALHKSLVKEIDGLRARLAAVERERDRYRTAWLSGAPKGGDDGK